MYGEAVYINRCRMYMNKYRMAKYKQGQGFKCSRNLVASSVYHYPQTESKSGSVARWWQEFTATFSKNYGHFETFHRQNFPCTACFLAVLVSLATDFKRTQSVP
jgi:hypothetical protein